VRNHERRKKKIQCFRYQESRGAPLQADHDPEEVGRLDEHDRRNREAVHRNRDAVRRNRAAVRRNREAVRRSHAAGPMVAHDRTRLAEQRELIATEHHRRKGRVGRRAHVRRRVGRRVRHNLQAKHAPRFRPNRAVRRQQRHAAPNRAYTMHAKAAGAPSANRQLCSFRSRALSLADQAGAVYPMQREAAARLPGREAVPPPGGP
jgi:hypothetical protein